MWGSEYAFSFLGVTDAQIGSPDLKIKKVPKQRWGGIFVQYFNVLDKGQLSETYVSNILQIM